MGWHSACCRIVVYYLEFYCLICQRWKLWYLRCQPGISTMWERKLSGQKRPWLNISHAAHCCFHLLRYYYFLNLNPGNTWKYWVYSFVHWFFIFGNRGQVSFSSSHLLLACTSALQVFDTGFWAENLGLHPTLTCTLSWNNVGAETGRDEKGVVFRFLVKFWSYSLLFFSTHAEHFSFHPWCPLFLMANIPQAHWI